MLKKKEYFLFFTFYFQNFGLIIIIIFFRINKIQNTLCNSICIFYYFIKNILLLILVK